jgi:hypothetical protein
VWLQEWEREWSSPPHQDWVPGPDAGWESQPLGWQTVQLHKPILRSCLPCTLSIDTTALATMSFGTEPFCWYGVTRTTKQPFFFARFELSFWLNQLYI